LAPLAVLDGELEEMLARADGSRGEGDAPDIEGAECRAESRANLPAEDVRLGDLAVFEDELPGVRAAEPHLVVDLSDAEALEILLDDESSDPAPRAFRPVVRGVDDDDVGDRPVRHPDLRAIQDPAAVAQPRARLDRRRVRPARRFGQRERGDLLSGGEIGKVAALLVFGTAEKDRHRADRGVRADDVRESRRRAPKLLEREAVPEIPGADTAVFLGEGESEEAELPHLLEHVARDLVGLLDLFLERLETRLHEVTRGARQELQLLGDVEVHALRLPQMDRRYPKG